jgi:hypothetical protein
MVPIRIKGFISHYLILRTLARPWLSSLSVAVSGGAPDMTLVSFIVLAPAGIVGGTGCVLFTAFPLPDVVIIIFFTKEFGVKGNPRGLGRRDSQ